MKANEVDNYINSSTPVSVWIKPTAWSTTKREIKAIPLARDGRRVHVRLVEQEIPNDLHSGKTATLIEREEWVSTNAVWSDWASVEENRARKAVEREEERQRWLVEYAAEKAAKRARVEEWSRPLRGIEVTKDVDTPNWPSRRWDDFTCDLAELLVDCFEDSKTITVREPLLEKIANVVGAFRDEIEELNDRALDLQQAANRAAIDAQFWADEACGE
jgi:hypothetical protein